MLEKLLARDVLHLTRLCWNLANHRFARKRKMIIFQRIDEHKMPRTGQVTCILKSPKDTFS